MHQPVGPLVPLVALGLFFLCLLAPGVSASPTAAWAEEVELVANATSGAFSPALAIDGDDSLHIVWVSANITAMVTSDEQGAAVTTFSSGNLFLMVVGQDGNVRVPQTQLTFLDDDEGYQIEAPSIGTDAAGNTHVVWSDTAGESSTYNVHYLKADPDGHIVSQLPIAVGDRKSVG